MKVIGDLEALRKEIIRKYEDDIAELEEEAGRRINIIKRAKRAEIERIKKEEEKRAKELMEEARRKKVSKEKANMRLKIHKKKEELINKVISEIEDELPKIAHSKKYLEYVKKNLLGLPKQAKEYKIYADSKYYEKSLGKKVFLDKTIIGVKIVTDKKTMDLSLTNLIKTKLSEIRMIANKELFGG